MTDYFALFDELRRPWLDEDALKAKFLKLAAESHPDRIHFATEKEKQAATDLYTALNQAHNTLREPKDRLLHLLELERGVKPTGIEGVPPEIMECFMEVGQLCREVDGFLANRATVTSPLLKVQMFERSMEWTERLNDLAFRLDALRSSVMGKLLDMNHLWEAAPPLGEVRRPTALQLDELERLYRTLSFVSRWISQLRERTVRLTL